MQLSKAGIKNREEWIKKGYELPEFNQEEVSINTIERPVWIHFGAGNIFRAFPAAAQQKLLNSGKADTGIIVCETFDEEIIDKAFTPYDNLTLSVTLKADGNINKSVVASITETIKLSTGKDRLMQIFESKSLQMASFTITEKGYSVVKQDGSYLPYIEKDLSGKPEEAESLMGLITNLCYKRYLAGTLPIALVSMDNCAHNGYILKSAVLTVAKAWRSKKYFDDNFIEYLENENKVSFPSSMIDKITPRPSEAVAQMLAKDGCTGMDIFKTSKNTYAAAFVNAEQTQYLVIEDKFPAGRPVLEEAGIIFTSKDIVDMTEKMKVGACLNPLHTILAIYGCLLGYTSIAEEMKNKYLVNFIKEVGYKESLPYVPNPGIIKPEDFINEVITQRFPNPFIPDTPQRIACDTSQKIPVRFGDVLKTMQQRGKDLRELKFIPLFFAGWLRYLMGIDDNGNVFEISPDPILEQLKPVVSSISLGDAGSFTEKLRPILSNKAIFGVDLYESGLAGIVEGYFNELISGKHAVSNTLVKYFS